MSYTEFNTVVWRKFYVKDLMFASRNKINLGKEDISLISIYKI